MAQFADTHSIAHHLSQIITHAEESLVLITPYIKFPDLLFERLCEADERGVHTLIVYGKTKLKDKEMNQFKQLNNVSIYFLENLHAKCYANESMVILSSMNLYSFSEKNNREMGIVLDRKKDQALCTDIEKECQSIIRVAEPIFERKTAKKTARHASKKTATEGHCIRCGKDIDYDPKAPLCPACYKKWAQYKNKNYEENYCHCCGDQVCTTLNTPVCNQCV